LREVLEMRFSKVTTLLFKAQRKLCNRRINEVETFDDLLKATKFIEEGHRASYTDYPEASFEINLYTNEVDFIANIYSFSRKHPELPKSYDKSFTHITIRDAIEASKEEM
jgi:predicted ester cyclase